MGEQQPEGLRPAPCAPRANFFLNLLTVGDFSLSKPLNCRYNHTPNLTDFCSSGYAPKIFEEIFFMQTLSLQGLAPGKKARLKRGAFAT
jgi:hypothetical protein